MEVVARQRGSGVAAARSDHRRVINSSYASNTIASAIASACLLNGFEAAT